MRIRTIFVLVSLAALLLPVDVGADPVRAGQTVGASQGQVVFVPAYSSVFINYRGLDMPLTVTLYVHNASPKQSITIQSVKYHDAHGALRQSFLEESLELAPLASVCFLAKEVKEKSVEGGANFLVRWVSGQDRVRPPIIECVMIGSQGTQGISLVNMGRVVEELEAGAE